MALPATGVITLAQVRTELGRSGVIALNDGTVRNLANRTSGLIGMNHLRGRTLFNLTLANFTGFNISCRGYNRPASAGSISPGQLKGLNIHGLYYSLDFSLLVLELPGIRAKNFFNSIQVVGGPVYNSSAMTHTQDTTYNITQWTASSSVPSNWTNGANRQVVVT